MKQIQSYSRHVIFFLAFFNLVGLLGLVLPVTRELFEHLTPLNLLLSTFLLLVFHERKKDRIGMAAVLIYLIGYFVEVLGVNSGVIFGSYAYGEVLGPKLFNTPLIIGVNWLMLTYMIWCFLRPFRLSIVYKILAGSLVMVLYDLVLEPAAIHFGMWEWTGETVPLQNYIAWFAVSVVIFTLLAVMKIKIHNKIAAGLLIIQLSFFLILDIIILI